MTATQGDTKLTTITDERGVFRFPELRDGVWTLQVEMLGFEKIVRQAGIAPDAPAPGWELKFLFGE